MTNYCIKYSARPAPHILHTDNHCVLTGRKAGIVDIPICTHCLERWRLRTHAVILKEIDG